ncbi:MAG TPA: DUF1566 domain-containing protein [Sunxiuqinia sp.]|nr:DUF1566 domain-containing protein [Sunxiuqinia sp.]
MRNLLLIIQLLVLLGGCTEPAITTATDQQEPLSMTYPIVDTGQDKFYNNLSEINQPAKGSTFFGQDAQYKGNQPSYTDNGDGTVTDNVTGLMWTQKVGDKLTYQQAKVAADTIHIGGYSDWRLPTIKDLYSLIQFDGTDPSGPGSSNPTPFLDTNYFDFRYGSADDGDRIIDAQYWSSTEYVSTTMWGASTTFGVNFADGRIKGYPNEVNPGGRIKKEFIRYVRENISYGENNFQDNGNGTVTDKASGLMWQKADNGTAISWDDALSYAETLDLAGYGDWRLPNAKELQSIVDYNRSPATTNSAAIDPLFQCTPITDEGGNTNYGFYWTGTTHASANGMGGYAIYIAFGEALGFMESHPGAGEYSLMDVHGAGAQRSDPKVGNAADYPHGHGPQGDVIRINNLARCVRTVN